MSEETATETTGVVFENAMKPIICQEIGTARGPVELVGIAKTLSRDVFVVQAHYETAVKRYKQANEAIKVIEKERVKIKEGILKSGQALDASANRSKAPFLEIKELLYPRIYAWEEELKRQEQEAEQAAIAEAKRLADDQALAAAAEAEQQGADPVVVNAILEDPMPVHVAKPEPMGKRMPGVTRQPVKKTRVVNVIQLAQWVVANPRYQHYLTGNIVAMNADLKQLKERFKVPGVEVI